MFANSNPLYERNFARRARFNDILVRRRIVDPEHRFTATEEHMGYVKTYESRNASEQYRHSL